MRIVGNVEVEEEVDLQLDELLKDMKEIVLFDDDYHTFDFVIESLIAVCKHSVIQAEQCTFIVHYNGKCAVKRGEYEKLKPMCTALIDRGLTAEIQ
ncbi:MAG TPA: ATP-dependent Clp protease adaptor ClpS [Cryomorphaceae bacterium]|nr:ATP-dependent Clp protease adaptor ClpS [Cryomorphaceae bacterium]